MAAVWPRSGGGVGIAGPPTLGWPGEFPGPWIGGEGEGETQEGGGQFYSRVAEEEGQSARVGPPGHRVTRVPAQATRRCPFQTLATAVPGFEPLL